MKRGGRVRERERERERERVRERERWQGVLPRRKIEAEMYPDFIESESWSGKVIETNTGYPQILLDIKSCWIFDRRIAVAPSSTRRASTAPDQDSSLWHDLLGCDPAAVGPVELTNSVIGIAMMKLYIQNVWVIKFLSISIDLILSFWSEMHSSVKNSNIINHESAE